MRPHPALNVGYGVCVWLARLAVGLIVFVGVVGVWPSLEQIDSEWLRKQIVWLRGNRSWAVIVLGGATTAFGAVAKFIGPPWFWSALTNILSEFQRQTFANHVNPDDGVDDHRVTLYRFKRFCVFPGNRWRLFWPWGKGLHPWSGWLVPVIRAGSRRRARTIFLASSATRCEGIVGLTYFRHGMYELDGLPDAAEPGNREIYAKETNVPVEWLQDRLLQGRPCARSFRSIRLLVDGKDWGVLMIDSRAERLPLKETVYRFRVIETVLRELLKRV